MEKDIKKGSSADFFLNLLVFGTLYTAAVSFISLWFQYIDFWFQEADFYGNYYYGYSSGSFQAISWATSVLVIVFPAFLIASWYLRNQFQKEPARREVRARKWLLHATLFIAGVTVIVDLITLVASFLSGGLTTSFMLKILVVLPVALAIFAYYRNESKHGSLELKTAKLTTVLIAVIMGASVVLSFILIGTPNTQRNRRFDERSVNDLQTLQNQVTHYWTIKRVLPEKLAELAGFFPYETGRLNDPRTGQPYEYRVIKQDSPVYELCANFKTASISRNGSGRDNVISVKPIYPGAEFPVAPETWEHGEGRVCFTRKIDPALYEKRPL